MQLKVLAEKRQTVFSGSFTPLPFSLFDRILAEYKPQGKRIIEKRGHRTQKLLCDRESGVMEEMCWE